MKIERKENKGLVEFGSLKCRDVFEDIRDNCVWMKIDLSDIFGYGDVNCISLEDGDREYILDSTKVKPYPNAKVVLEDE